MAAKLSKNLPKRASNTRLKDRRHASWLRGQERKTARRKANARRHEANRALLAVHGYTYADMTETARRRVLYGERYTIV